MFKLNSSLFVLILIITKFKQYKLNSKVNQRFYTNTSSALKEFRFRDFEPRYAMKTEVDVKPLLFDQLQQNIRKPRGFHFATDDKDFNVELEFIIPFVHVPIKKNWGSMTKSAFRSLFQLNVQTLLTTGAIVFVGGVIALIVKAVLSDFVYTSVYRKASRLENANESELLMQYYSGNETEYIPNITKFSSIMETKLQENNINISHCVQRYICDYAQLNFCNSDKGGLPRIMDGLLSLNEVHSYMSGTAIKDALDAAKNGDNCFEIFSDCNLSLPMTTFMKFAKNLNFFK